jgi:glucose/mannose-6-phosphate isomerase
MINVDDPATYTQLDPGDMFGRIAELPDQCRAGWTLGQALDLPDDYRQVDQVVIVGMGGSAISGAVLAALVAPECRAPVLMIRDYDLPAWVSPATLVIAASHSGNTEETLTAFEQARARGCKLVTIATGGTLAQRAARYAAPLVRYEYNACPRATLGYSLAPMLAVMGKLGLVRDYAPDMEEAVAVMRAWQAEIAPDAPVARNSAKRLAGQMMGRAVVIWGSSVLAQAARRFKGQLNENAKTWASFEILPEADHNAIEGVQFPEDVLPKLFVLFLTSSLDHPRVQLRCRLSRESLMTAGVNTEALAARGQSALAQVLGVIHYTDYVSGYLALLNNVDPNAMDAITNLKQRMAGQQL